MAEERVGVEDLGVKSPGSAKPPPPIPYEISEKRVNAKKDVLNNPPKSQ